MAHFTPTVEQMAATAGRTAAVAGSRPINLRG
jgi:hypothetical protein